MRGMGNRLCPLRGPSIGGRGRRAEKLALFNSLFAMRNDVFAKSCFSKKTGRVGYAPACVHEWKGGVCGKPRVKCADCSHREFLPLDGEVLKAHFRGTGREGIGIVAG